MANAALAAITLEADEEVVGEEEEEGFAFACN